MQLLRKFLHSRSHIGWCAVKVTWQTDHYGAHAVVFFRETRDLPGDDLQRIHVEAGTQHRQRPRQRAGEVADGNANALFPDIETHHPHA